MPSYTAKKPPRCKIHGIPKLWWSGGTVDSVSGWYCEKCVEEQRERLRQVNAQKDLQIKSFQESNLRKGIKRTKSDCKNCAFTSRVKCWGRSEFKPILAIFGEAPGEVEDQLGEPFVGPAGRFLRVKLNEAGINQKVVHFSNVIPCRPDHNDITCPDSLEAIALCRGGFVEELQKLKSLGVKVLMPMGNTPIAALGLSGTITKIRGSVFGLKLKGNQIVEEPADPDFWVVPTFHPSFILRGMQKEEPTWLNDMAKALDMAVNGYKAPEENFNLFPTLRELENCPPARTVKMSNPKRLLIGVDIETSGPDIMVCGIAWSEEDAISIPFLSQGRVPYWQGTQHDQAVGCLKRILTSNKCVFQNAQYDVPRLEAFIGTRIAVAHDTMLIHHNLHPELPHNLGYIVSAHGKTPYWKDIVLSSPEAVANQPDETLRRYNLRDCVVLLQVLPELIKETKEQGSYQVYESIALRLIRPTIEMSKRGIGLSQSRLKKLKEELTDHLNDVELQIRHKLQLPKSFNIRSDQDVRWLLYGDKPLKADRSIEALAEYETNPRLKKGTKKHVQLQATAEIFSKVRPLYRTSASVRKTDGGAHSIDDEALLGLRIAANNRRALVEKFKRPTNEHRTELKEIARLTEFLKLFGEYNKYDKLISTYTKFPTGPDGRVHARFLTHGTATGRLSSRDPNLQNIPIKKEPDDPVIKAVFIPSPGYVFVQADFSNLELRVLAYEANDDVLQKQFAEGRNIHDENTKIMFGIDKDHPRWKATRRAAKIYVFGRNYGGGVRGIYEKVVNEAPELGLTFSDFCAADEAYFAAHPKYQAWYNKVQADVKVTRTCKTAFGRIRYFLGTENEIVREGLNTPIQSTAADIANVAVIEIYEEFQNQPELDAWLIATVHDSVLVECPTQNVQKVADILKTCMERPRKLWGKTVSFPVDLEASNDSWGALVPLAEYLKDGKTTKAKRRVGKKAR